MDDWPKQTFNATKSNFAARVLLFQADNLGNGTHDLTVVNDSDLQLEIDYAIVRRLEAPLR